MPGIRADTQCGFFLAQLRNGLGVRKLHKTGKLVKSAKAGDSFGELALLYYAPRAATVTASSDSAS